MHSYKNKQQETIYMSEKEIDSMGKLTRSQETNNQNIWVQRGTIN